ncbi:chitooligosaccharide deacetylase, partial [Bacillus paranthracis]|nr:chitooligosaccharide deacetylase [Bacillus paranthracis]
MLKQKVFLVIFSLLCAVHIFQVEKVEAKMLLRKELEL